MKITETNFLWQCYQRWYQPEEPVPHPKNLCRFWWISVLGFLKRTFLDFNFFLVLFSLVAIVGGLVLTIVMLDQMNIPPWMAWPILLVSVPSVILLLVFPLARFMIWLEGRLSEKAQIRFLQILGSCFVLFILGTIIRGIIRGEVHWEAWRELLIIVPSIAAFLFLVFLGRGIYLLILHPFSMKEGFQTFLAWWRAKKQKVCPLVEPPDSWSQEEE